MPELTPLPDGSVQVTDETGSTYIMPEDSAARLYPEQMQQHYQPIDFPQMDGPQAGQYDPSMGPPTIANQLAQAQPVADEGMVMEPMVIGGEEPEMVMEPMQLEDQPGEAPAPPWRQSQSRSASVSRSGTGPYREHDPTRPPAPPGYEDVAEAALVAAAQRKEGLAQQREATQRHMGAMDEQYGALAAQREETARRSQEMHDAGMQEVAQAEARLAERTQNMQRMDMNKVWKETPLGARMVGVFSAGIAGWLNPTGQNSVIQQMSDLMDKSAREQAENMAQERFQIGMQQSALDRLERRGEASRRVYLENRAVLESSLLSQIQMEKTKYSSEITLANLMELEAAATEKYMGTIKELRDTSYNQGIQRWNMLETHRQHAADRRQRAAQFRQSMAMKQAEAEAKAKADALKAAKGRALFVRDDGKVVYANPEMEISDAAWKDFDADLKVSRSLASSAKKLMALVADHGRVWSKLEPDEQAAVKQQLGDIIEQMRPKVGANLTQIEKKNLEEQFGDPLGILKSPEVTEQLLNRAIGNINERIDLNLSTWGSRTYDDVEVEGLGRVPIPSRYQRGDVSGYFGQEFEGLNLSDAMEATAEKSLQEIEEYQNQLADDTSLGPEGRKDIERKIAASAAGLLDYTMRQDLNAEQNAALYEIIMKRTAGIDEELFRSEMIRHDLTPLPPGIDPSEAFSMASERSLEGSSLEGILAAEEEQYGPLGAKVRAVQGLGPLTAEQYEEAASRRAAPSAPVDLTEPGALKKGLGW